mgnify:CR=1 FL=1
MTLKIAAIPLVLLLSLGLSGCDEYEGLRQCELKEMQKCKSRTCERTAKDYCHDNYGPTQTELEAACNPKGNNSKVGSKCVFNPYQKP